MGKHTNFTEAKLTRAIRGWMAAGLPHPRCTIQPDGSIVLMAGNDAGASDEDEYSSWKATRK